MRVINSHNFEGDDLDASAYITSVESADGMSLPLSTKGAINSLVVGLKADGLWEKITAICLFAGPSKLAGALVPLKGPTPTNDGFVAGDHSAAKGVKGDGTSKRILSGVANASLPQDDFSMGVFVTELATSNSVYIGAADPSSVPGATSLYHLGIQFAARCRAGAADTLGTANTGIVSFSRSTSTGFDWIIDTSSGSIARDSQSPYDGPIVVFDRTTGSGASSDARIATYWIGNAMDLSKMKTRIDNYMAAVDI